MKLSRALTREHLSAYWAEREALFVHRQADLSDLSQLDSIGLAFLVQWSQALGAEQGPLTLLSPPPSFKPLAALYGVGAYFELNDTKAGSHHGFECTS